MGIVFPSAGAGVTPRTDQVRVAIQLSGHLRDVCQSDHFGFLLRAVNGCKERAMCDVFLFTFNTLHPHLVESSPHNSVWRRCIVRSTSLIFGLRPTSCLRTGQSELLKGASSHFPRATLGFVARKQIIFFTRFLLMEFGRTSTPLHPHPQCDAQAIKSTTLQFGCVQIFTLRLTSMGPRSGYTLAASLLGVSS